MRRDYFTLEVRNTESATGDGEAIPTIRVAFEGPSDRLLGRLTDDGDEPLEADEIDVAYRLQAPVDGGDDDADAPGVLGITNRITGEFVLELNAPAEDVLEFVHAARTYGNESDDDDRYRVRITVDDETVATYDKTTLLIYDEEGNLLHEHSLIPNNVEL